MILAAARALGLQEHNLLVLGGSSSIVRHGRKRQAVSVELQVFVCDNETKNESPTEDSRTILRQHSLRRRKRLVSASRERASPSVGRSEALRRARQVAFHCTRQIYLIHLYLLGSCSSKPLQPDPSRFPAPGRTGLACGSSRIRKELQFTLYSVPMQ